MNRLSIKLRSRGRKLGLHRLAHRIQTKLKRNKRYEESFNTAPQDAVHPGDVVWDVGANEGIYTELFCRWVGPQVMSWLSNQILNHSPRLDGVFQSVPGFPL